MTTAAQASSSKLRGASFELRVASRSIRRSGHRLFEEVLTLQQPVIDYAWEELSERATRCLGLGYAAFRHLQGEAIRVRKLEALQRPISETFARVFQTIARSEQSADFVQKLRENLEQSDPQLTLNALLKRHHTASTPLPRELVERIRAAVTTRPIDRIDFEDSIRKLAKGKTKGVSLLEPYTLSAGTSLVINIDHFAQFALLCLCRGLLATVHSEFNFSLKSALLPEQPAAFDEVRPIATRIVDDFKWCLQSGQQNIYAALVTDQPMSEIADKAVSLAGKIERTLPMFVRAQATIRVEMLRLREQGKGTASKQIGRLGLRAGVLTREAIASHCACYRLAMSVLSPEPASDIAYLQKNTDSLPFDTILPNGKNTVLKKLGASVEGAFVEIEGFVQKVEAKRQSDGKLIGHVKLVDPASGNTADAVAVFAHLPHAGVTKDAFCQLSGIFTMNSVLFQGNAAVETDVLSFKELSKASWRIAFLQLADRWFQPWRNNMNLYWSLGPHGTSDDGEGFFGAGELLFTPFVRN